MKNLESARGEDELNRIEYALDEGGELDSRHPEFFEVFNAEIHLQHQRLCIRRTCVKVGERKRVEQRPVHIRSTDSERDEEAPNPEDLLPRLVQQPHGAFLDFVHLQRTRFLDSARKYSTLAHRTDTWVRFRSSVHIFISLTFHIKFYISNSINKTVSAIAVVEGRGQARGEIGIAALDLRNPQLTLAQFSDTSTYVKTITTVAFFEPLEVTSGIDMILIPHTAWEGSLKTPLVETLTNRFPRVTKSAVHRRFFNETKGMHFFLHLCAPEYAHIKIVIMQK
ncbi:unnamed protein product [Darwinula stevensoni]|uniref:Uncharacterized protein n=1 Tax=Darwinula stevensoni TaxID=69355 RepID=A0A7R8ZZU5_9CRUS|nr:unnamed protein product [Darwinula stevensoni]CAG0884460.1 unnamed protein product [Darwinula stevensoni]